MFGKKRREKKDFNLTYDNLAIPEVHTNTKQAADDSTAGNAACNSSPSGEADDELHDDIFMDCDKTMEHEVNYEGVAIPEVHINKKRRQ